MVDYVVAPLTPDLQWTKRFLLFVLAELSYITYHAGLTHFLLAHLIAEVLDVLALVAIAVGFGKRVVTGIAPVVSGTAQHR